LQQPWPSPTTSRPDLHSTKAGFSTTVPAPISQSNSPYQGQQQQQVLRQGSTWMAPANNSQTKHLVLLLHRISPREIEIVGILLKGSIRIEKELELGSFSAIRAINEPHFFIILI